MKGILPKFMLDFNISRIIKSQARRNEEVVYGAQAIRHQIPDLLARPTSDYDLFSRAPRKSARQLERTLDKKAMGDWFYVKPAMHEGTYKVMDKGLDGRKGTLDDFGVADYTIMPRGLKTRRVRGVRYVKLSEISKGKRKILKDPESEYRHEKDRIDLERIKQAKQIRRFIR